MFNKKVKDRFWSKVKKTKTCWNWTASLIEGYGTIKINSKNVYAHRFSWELTNGLIPKKLCVLHKCDNRSCVNHKHLFLGTKQDNAQDRNSKNRHFKVKGEANGRAKLIEKQVLEIRHLYSLGNIKHIELAKDYKVCCSVIGQIIRRKLWKHI